MKKSKNKPLIIFLSVSLVLIFFSGAKTNLPSAEDIDIYLGVAYNLKKIGKDTAEYIISTIGNNYKEDGTIENRINIGRGSTVGNTREDRQRKIGKKFFLGLSKVYLVDVESAEEGVKNVLDILFKNPTINDNAFLVICKGNAEEYLKYNQEGYENPGEYIGDMIKNSVSFNFWGENYTIKNAMLSMYIDGKNIVCPYLSLEEDGIKMSGAAIFKKDKLAVILDMNDTKIMNMLRENKTRGVLTIQKNSEEYVNCDTKVKRKVSCNKVGDKYEFIINLNLNGEVLNNKLYKNMSEKISVVKNFEEDMEKKVEQMCYVFLDKMKNQYKVDCLQLGWVAAGKYGRAPNIDWDKVVCNSDIKVNVKVHLDKLGRGEF